MIKKSIISMFILSMAAPAGATVCAGNLTVVGTTSVSLIFSKVENGDEKRLIAKLDRAVSFKAFGVYDIEEYSGTAIASEIGKLDLELSQREDKLCRHCADNAKNIRV